MKRKILALVSAMALTLTLTACSESKEDIQNQLSGSNSNSNTTNNAAQQEENNSNIGGNNSDETESKKEDAKKFTHGVITDSSYTSSFFGITAEFGSNWEVYTDEDMADQNNASDMSDSSVNGVLDKSAVLYEMMASIDTGSNVNIVVENLNVTNNGKSLTGEEYLNLSLDGLKQGLVASYGDATANVETTTLCGKTFPCIKAVISSNGVTATEILVPVVKDNYVGIVTFTALDDADMQTLMDAFKTVG